MKFKFGLLAITFFSICTFSQASQKGYVTYSKVPIVSLSTGITGSLPAASVAAGALGSGVVAASFTAPGAIVASYTLATVNYDKAGRIVSASSGTASGGGGSSTLAVATGTSTGFNSNISSPTAIIVFSSHTFGARLTGTATAYITQNFNWPVRVETARSTSTTAGCAIQNSVSNYTQMLLCDPSLDEDAGYNTFLSPYSGGTLYADVFFTMTSATSGNVVDTMQVFCSTSGATTDVDAVAWPAPNSATIAVPGTAGFPTTGTITLSTVGGSCVQGALIMARFTRNGSNSSDNATGDQEVRLIRIREN